MHSLIFFFCLFIFIMGVSSRHLDEVSGTDSVLLEQNDGLKKHSADQTRHRRRRWQMNYGYDYPSPSAHSYFPERRDYDRNQQDLLPQIVKLLEEIASYVRRPQPQMPQLPQPIYIPYPVPYPIHQFNACPDNATKKPSVHTRFPEMEDTNQNWGFVINKDDDIDDLSDGARPISFDPIKPLRPMKRPVPKVEHGTEQGNSQQPSTQAPTFNDESSILRSPSMCNAAILSCCADDKSQQRQCFSGFRCTSLYESGNACTEDSISIALESFKSAYSPVQ